MIQPQRKIVRIIARLNVGGPARHVTVLAHDLPGFRSILVAGEVGHGEIEMRDVLDARRLQLHRIPTLGRAMRPLDDLRTLIQLIALLRRERPAVVHTHTAKAGTLGRIAAVIARVPIRVHTYHGHVFHSYFGALQTRLILVVEKVLARFTTRVIAISEQQKQELATRFRICAEDRISVIPLGLEFEHLAPEAALDARKAFRKSIGVSDEVVIASIGRMVPIKNQQLLITAFANCGVERAVLVFVGSGEEESALRAETRALGIDGCVRFLGWRSDLANIYAGADVVALTSRNEGTPVCLIEALAAGCPVVATDVGGVRDVLEHGRLGVLVPPDDAAAFAAALRNLICDLPAARAAAGTAAAHVRQRYGVQRLRDEIAALYETLLAPHEAHSREPAEHELVAGVGAS